MKNNLLHIVFLFVTVLSIGQNGINNKEVIYLWPKKVPGEELPKQKAVVTPNNKNNVKRITDITNPNLTVYHPEESIKNGSSIIICPGGGYRILAIDLEGHEIASWFTKQGFTTFVLEYRVPNKQAGALMDVQRAMRIIRSSADKWNINPNKIGVLGFSAGASLAARISTNYNNELYPKIDNKDSISAKPNFAVLIYPAYLDLGESKSLTPELKLTKDTPPMFVFATADDPYANSSLVMASALNDKKIAVELHLYPIGGHGYGLRKGNDAAEKWPLLANEWLTKILK